MPTAVLKRMPAAGGGPTMFRGLDQRIGKRDRSTTVLSVCLHVGAVAAILGLLAFHGPVVQTAQTVVSKLTLYAPPPPVMQVAPVKGGGGGGGAHHVIAPVRAKLPETVVKRPTVILMPRIIKVDPPKLPVQPMTPINMPQAAPMPKLGDPQSPQVAMASQGPGASGGFGFGMNGGLGSGHGTGQGPGANGGSGGGIMNVGGGVSAPIVIHSVEPQFSAQAREANHQGTVAIQLIVDSQGFPQDVRVARRLGMGLDEEAVAAVRQYRFKPAMYEGHPVPVQMIIEVEFRLH